MQKHYLKILTVFTLVFSLTACDLPANPSSGTLNMVRQRNVSSLWDRMTGNFHLKTHTSNTRVARFIKQYSKYEAQNLIEYSAHAEPYLYHIVTALEERNMPAELALLPIIESEYRPAATSKAGAVGLWQLASITGRVYGLKNDNYYDARKDFEIATVVALDHLQYLVDRYNGDWLIALAAYNSGHGRVDQAIRNNKRLGKPCDYWSLNLPRETMYFVPKFLALAHLVQNADKLGIKLAEIENKPYFTTVNLKQAIDLNKAAALAKVDVKEIKKLNSGLRTNTTHPKGPHKILLPVKNAYIFRANYVSQSTPKVAAKPKKTVTAKPASKNKSVHIVYSGDTLNQIATKYNTTVKSLMQKNNLKSDIIISGQQLFI